MRLSKRKPLDYYNLLFCLSIIASSIVSLFTQILRKIIGDTGKLDTLLVYGLLILLLAKIFPSFRTAFNIKDLVFLFFLSIVFITSSLRSINDAAVTKEVLASILFKCLPAYMGAKLVHDSPELNNYLRFSAGIVLLNVLAKTYFFSVGSLTQMYSQYDGYLLLTAMALLFVPLVLEHKVFDIVVAGVTLLMTLLTGARGPFLFSTILFLLGLFLMNWGRKFAVLLYGILLTSMVVVYFNMQKILISIALFLGDSGSLRTINRLLNNELISDNLRLRQFAHAWEYIGNHLFTGCGVINDRVIINRFMPELGEVIGSYPHNFFLEIGMQYGMIPAVVIIIIFAWLLISRFNRCVAFRGKLLMVSLFFAGFVPLMVSGSYLEWTMFYVLIGFCTRMDSFGGQSLDDQIS